MRGQISVSWIIGVGVSIVLAAFGTMTATNYRIDDRVGGVQKEVAQVSERTAKLETIVPVIDKRLESIERSLKMIEQKIK